MTKVKKMLGMVMAALLCFAFTPAAAFAADEVQEMDTLSINGAIEGHTYKVYQMLTGQISEITAQTTTNDDNTVDMWGSNGTIQRVNRGANLSSDISVNDFIKVVTADGVSEGTLGNEVYKYITGDAVATLTKAKPSVGVVPGYYLIVDTGDVVEGDAFSRFMVTVAGNTTITPKKDAPTLSKEIVDSNLNDGSNSTAAIGDVVDYKLTSKVPDMEGYGTYIYTIVDEMSEGLTFTEDDDHPVTFEIGDKKLEKGTDYTLTQVGQTVTLTIANLKAIAGINVGDTIVVTYSATINDKAHYGTDPNTNTAHLVYSNNPSHSGEGSPNPDNVTGETGKVTVNTFVTGLKIFKYETVDGAKQALEGAEFTLEGSNLNKVIMKTEEVFVASEKGTYYLLLDGTYTEDEPNDQTLDQYADLNTKYAKTIVATGVSETVTGTPKAITGAVDENGMLYFYGLNEGAYTLTESKTPEGYNGINPIEFTINAELKDGKIQWSSNNEKIGFDGGNGVFSTEVENLNGLTLPSTGGMGTTILYIVGGALVVAAIAFLVVRRRNAAK